MQAIHFTPGTLDPDNVRRHGTVAHMPLASGRGTLRSRASTSRRAARSPWSPSGTLSCFCW
jgi:hypothetical protein